MKIDTEILKQAIEADVTKALKEDIGDGDITAELIPKEKIIEAQIISRDAAVVCGLLWVEEVFKQLDKTIDIHWQVQDGDQIEENKCLVTFKGSARKLLSGERVALNFLQTLSGTATLSAEYSKLVVNSNVQILDTRKTLPGLRIAQKYAVEIGGCKNHRIGLYDAFLIKENHIAACGSIGKAVQTAKQSHPDKSIEVEVENLKELEEAISAKADIVMLDNFSVSETQEAVNITKGRCKLESSGGIDETRIKELINTKIDYISVGALTKHCNAIDLSFRVIN